MITWNAICFKIAPDNNSVVNFLVHILDSGWLDQRIVIMKI